MENNNHDKRSDYRGEVSIMGKKEFTLQKMQEYGFWPDNIPSPYEKQKNESSEIYNKRKELQAEFDDIAEQISGLYKECSEIDKELQELKQQYADTWDYDKIRKDVANKIMQESIKRRAERKAQREAEKQQKSEKWKKQKSDSIVFIGRGYSGGLSDKETDEGKLFSLGLPVIKDDKDLADVLDIEYKELRLLAYHRDVVVTDNYFRYTIPKKSGGERNIAAPKPSLKKAQRNILELILNKIEVSKSTHGFLKSKSVISGASIHKKQPVLLINMDIEDFFPTITFERVRGLFKSFGYSGYISSLIAMICTYCERIPIEIKGQTKYVKATDRILPQGSPASPMITNIICRNIDKKINGLEVKYNFTYTRYADDMSFSFQRNPDKEELKKILYEINQIIYDEGFKIKKEKTRFLKKNNRQSITGIVINNQEIGVPKVWIKRMRAAIYNANSKKEKISAQKIHELSGMVSWLKSVNYGRYKNIIDEAEKIIKNN